MVMVQDNRQILIVEDDEDTAEVVCTLLNEAGYNAVSVDRGEAALTEIASQSPDLVLLDCDQPEMNGIEFTRRLRAIRRAIEHMLQNAGAVWFTQPGAIASHFVSVHSPARPALAVNR